MFFPFFIGVMLLFLFLMIGVQRLFLNACKEKRHASPWIESIVVILLLLPFFIYGANVLFSLRMGVEGLIFLTVGVWGATLFFPSVSKKR
ncbi:MAG: hypothetical protein V1776_00665 [Candidatus Diapherotrites archaeon]